MQLSRIIAHIALAAAIVASATSPTDAAWGWMTESTNEVKTDNAVEALHLERNLGAGGGLRGSQAQNTPSEGNQDDNYTGQNTPSQGNNNQGEEGQHEQKEEVPTQPTPSPSTPSTPELPTDDSNLPTPTPTNPGKQGPPPLIPGVTPETPVQFTPPTPENPGKGVPPSTPETPAVTPAVTKPHTSDCAF
ncbi:hypothetical protein PPTG_18611 [Phytophthora nicotianae INRA-310]|uniref:RxLR effector protein n=4 Tax=Phytophthora nicotianae TaxID=4792 RepID=W2PIG5_PHYN3|nr:hypothetical protein PPTG_18611 [Phytophthora nicotianae INRA-310]ETM99799.1 hypothetical protein PPTG_18611 [Phytophthora nicotianae INRA-310]